MSELTIFGLVAVGIWAAVELIKHLVPDYYERERQNTQIFYSEMKADIAALEARFESALGFRPVDLNASTPTPATSVTVVAAAAPIASADPVVVVATSNNGAAQ